MSGISKLPEYKGYPIPFTVLVDATTGVPDFKVTDIDKWQRCVTEKLCGICGDALDYWVWFIGSESHADHGLYFDPPMHERCARFSAATCPFIARGKAYATTIKQHGGVTIVERGVATELRNPPTMWLTRARRDALVLVIHQGGHLVKTGAIVEREQIEREVSQ